MILNAAKSKLSIDRITAFDFITIYGKDFGVSEYNLHGDNNYRFSEYASKREIVSQSIKELVLKGYIKPHCNKSGFSYDISKNGISFCESLNNDYADCFVAIVNKAIVLFSSYSDRKLTHCINEYAVAMFGGK
jgi:hypothetical protein